MTKKYYFFISIVIVFVLITLGCGSSGGGGGDSSDETTSTSTTITSTEGGTITLGDASIVIPANALGTNSAVTFNIETATPTYDADLTTPVGDPYKISIEGYRYFSSSIEVTIPYTPSSLPAGVSEEAIFGAFWDGYHWHEMNTTVSPDANTITVNLRSLVGDGNLRALETDYGTAGIYDLILQSQAYNQLNPEQLTYSTAHFNIYYYNEGSEAATYDAEVDQLGQGTLESVPDYIEDLGYAFEIAYTAEAAMEFEMPSSPISVYVKDLGSANLGGYTQLNIRVDNNNLRVPTDPGVAPDTDIRAVSAHEFFHKVQDQYYTLFGMNLSLWWTESTTPWMEDKVWGRTTIYGVRKRVRDRPKFINASLNTNSPVTHPYAVSAFIKYLDDNYQLVGQPNIVQRIMARSASIFNPILSSVDYVLENDHSSSLSTAFHNFAKDYLYFNNQYSITTSDLLELTMTVNDEKYKLFSSADYADPAVGYSQPHLSAHLHKITSTGMATDTTGKIVLLYIRPYINITPVTVIEENSSGTLVASNEIVAGGTESYVIASFGSGSQTTANIYLISCNRSSDFDGVWQMKAYVLLPPQNVTAESNDDGDAIELDWDASSLEAFTDVFAGYNIYRKQQYTETSYTKLNSSPTTSNSYTDTTAEEGYGYYYIITEVDADGNESIDSDEIFVRCGTQIAGTVTLANSESFPKYIIDLASGNTVTVDDWTEYNSTPAQGFYYQYDSGDPSDSELFQVNAGFSEEEISGTGEAYFNNLTSLPDATYAGDSATPLNVGTIIAIRNNDNDSLYYGKIMITALSATSCTFKYVLQTDGSRTF